MAATAPTRGHQSWYPPSSDLREVKDKERRFALPHKSTEMLSGVISTNTLFL
jgi:hypothetical protein